MPEIKNPCDICGKDWPRLITFDEYGVRGKTAICDDCQLALVQSLVNNEELADLKRRVKEEENWKVSE